MYPAPIIKTSEDFLSTKPTLQKSPRAKMDVPLPGYLSTPPVPDYDHGEIFSGPLKMTRN
jgi:hypothetical protein